MLRQLQSAGRMIERLVCTVPLLELSEKGRLRWSRTIGFVYRQIGFGTSCESLACYATETGTGMLGEQHRTGDTSW